MAWRRLYLSLLVLRLYLALSPSYIHPDEHFQGPQVVAGDIFQWQVPKTWEFTTSSPIRSIAPLWMTYAIPLEILRWISLADPSPRTIFYTLRTMFFIYSFVLEDGALQELLPTIYSQHAGLLLTASSYVTWSYQSHTFSNSVETIALLWALVLMKRIQATKESRLWHCGLLGLNVVLGTFNRITFPAFLILPGIQLLRFFRTNYLAFCFFVFSVTMTTATAVYMDTSFYGGAFPSFPFQPVITPLNNVMYNLSSANLALHGLHPLYTHFLVNLPQLLGPAIILIFTSGFSNFHSPLFQSAVSGVAFLSLFRHQEARFLIPAVPLFLCSIKLPTNRIAWHAWMVVWVLFNAVYGVLMGVFHQGGVVPAQLFLSENAGELGLGTAVWWKTYSPPTWLLGPLNGFEGNDAMTGKVYTVDLMGAKLNKLVLTLEPLAGCSYTSTITALNSTALHTRNYLIAPMSAIALDNFVATTDKDGKLVVPSAAGKYGAKFHLEEVFRFRRHLHLDDMDFGDDGVMPTLERVIGRRGIGVWEIIRDDCDRTGTKISQMAKGIKEQVLQNMKEL